MKMSGNSSPIANEQITNITASQLLDHPRVADEYDQNNINPHKKTRNIRIADNISIM